MQCVYIIDGSNRLIEIDQIWDKFAIDNDSPHLVADRVRGQSLWDHISDRETKQLYKMLTQRARETNRQLTFPFRCDSPAKRRHMRMNITSADQQHVQFVSTILKEEEREAVRLFDVKTQRTHELIRICSWCKMVDTLSAGWQEVEAAIDTLQLFDEPRLPQITHSICPSCYKSVLGLCSQDPTMQ